jgi:hypothetical protein
MPHQVELIFGHRPERVIRSVSQASRLFRISVATQIRAYDREILRKPRCDARPHSLVLREAVQEKDWRSGAAYHGRDFNRSDHHALILKAFEHASSLS